jgi:hypothetical protein
MMAANNLLRELRGVFSSNSMARNPILGKIDPRDMAQGLSATQPMSPAMSNALIGFVPGVGDAIGLGQDVANYATNPSSRSWLNYGLSAAALVPGIPRMNVKIAGRAADFKYGEDADDFLYHVTTPEAAARIAKEGFKGGSGRSVWGGAYAGHSKGKVFLTEKNRVGYWRDRIQEGMEQEMDDVPDLVVVRVPRSEVPDIKPDEAAGIIGGSYYFQPK